MSNQYEESAEVGSKTGIMRRPIQQLDGEDKVNSTGVFSRERLRQMASGEQISSPHPDAKNTRASYLNEGSDGADREDDPIRH